LRSEITCIDAIALHRCFDLRPLLEDGITEIEDLPAIDRSLTGDENQQMIGFQPGGLQAHSGHDRALQRYLELHSVL